VRRDFSAEERNLSSHFVLVVDDNEMLREIFKKLGARVGVSCLLASSGKEAISVCNSNSFESFSSTYTCLKWMVCNFQCRF
jgi:CheY-like chemotaxis protein